MARLFKRITSDQFIDEMNRLFWIEPLDNRGAPDAGWSCREHAWALALLYQINGRPASVLNGSVKVVAHLGQRSERLVLDVPIHSWTGVDGNGFFDFSLKPDLELPGNLGQLPLGRVIGSRMLPKVLGKALFVANPEEGDIAVENANPSGRQTVLVYKGDTIDSLLPDYVTYAIDFINSPLTDRLKTRFDSSIYAKSVLFLNDFLHGRRASIRDVSAEGRWQLIDREYHDAVTKVLELAQLRSATRAEA
jgi:hypothetical protein